MMKRNTLIMSLLLLFVAMFATDAFAQRAQIDASDRYRYRFDSRLQFDGAIYNDNKNELNPNWFNRRTVFRYTGDLGPDRMWRARIDFEMPMMSFETRDMWIRWKMPEQNFYIKLGYFKPMFWLENNVGHARPRFDFMERSVANAFSRSRQLGINFLYFQDQYSFNLGFGNQDVSDSRIVPPGESVGKYASFRATVAPILQDDRWVHLGASVKYRTPDHSSGDTFRYRERPESRAGTDRFYNTGNIPGVDNNMMYNVEAMAVFNTIWLGGAYIMTNVNRFDEFEDLSFSGGYVFLSWAVTGESRSYESDDADPGRLQAPISKWGALSLGVRYSFIDLNDKDIAGGSGNHITIAATYYPARNVWFQFNVGIADMDEHADGGGSYIGGDNFQFLQARAGVWF